MPHGGRYLRVNPKLIQHVELNMNNKQRRRNEERHWQVENLKYNKSHGSRLHTLYY